MRERLLVLLYSFVLTAALVSERAHWRRSLEDISDKTRLVEAQRWDDDLDIAVQPVPGLGNLTDLMDAHERRGNSRGAQWAKSRALRGADNASQIYQPRVTVGKLTNIQWLHIPKTGTSFVGTLWNYACGANRSLDLSVDPRFNNNTECRKSCYDFALMERYPKAIYCEKGVLHKNFQTMHNPLPLGWQVNVSVVAMFRRPSQRIISAYHHVIMHAAGFSENTTKKLLSQCKGKGAGCYARFDGIAGCMARMLTGGTCAEDPLARRLLFKNQSLDDADPATPEFDTSTSTTTTVSTTTTTVTSSSSSSSSASPTTTTSTEAAEDNPQLQIFSIGAGPLPHSRKGAGRPMLPEGDADEGPFEPMVIHWGRAKKPKKKVIVDLRPRVDFDYGFDRVKEAVANIRHLAFVGLTEEWDESICLFHRMFGGRLHPAELKDFHQGEGRSDNSADYDEAELGGFRDEADEAVYAAAKARFYQLHREHVPAGMSACDITQPLAQDGRCSCTQEARECGPVQDKACDCGVCPRSRLKEFYRINAYTRCSDLGQCVIGATEMHDLFSWSVNDCLFNRSCVSPMKFFPARVARAAKLTRGFA